MSLKEWADLHGEDYPSRFRHSTSNKPLTIKDLQFCFDELLGELGWGDEIAETGVDPLAWARDEIKRLQRREKSLELRDAANDGHWLDTSTSTYKELAELREKQTRLTQRAPDVCHECGESETIDPNNDGVPTCVHCGTRR